MSAIVAPTSDAAPVTNQLTSFMTATAPRRESPQEQARRAWVERQQTFMDRDGSSYEPRLPRGTQEERKALSQEFADYRGSHIIKRTLLRAGALGTSIGSPHHVGTLGRGSR
jgi:hypothetical protein